MQKELQEGRPMGDLPPWLLPRLVSTGVFSEAEINQVAANRYTGTTGIAAHVEDPLSFGTLAFERPTSGGALESIFSVWVEQQVCLVMFCIPVFQMSKWQKVQIWPPCL